MNDQKLTFGQAIIIILVLAAIVLSLYYIGKIALEIKQTDTDPVFTNTPTSTLIPTPLPTTDYFAITTAATDCFAGPDPSYQVVAHLPVHQHVMVLGKNSDAGDWFFVRWSSPDRDCWAPAYRVIPGFDLAGLDLIDTPSPPTTTPTITATSTTGFVILEISPTPRQTKTPRTAQTASLTLSPTLTLTLTLTKPVAPSDTPTHTLTPTRTLTPTPTNTPTSTHTPTNTACVPPSAPELSYQLSTNKKDITLEWTSASRATAYQLYRSTGGNSFSAFGPLTTQRSAQDNKQPNDRYGYYVVASNGCGTAASNVVEVHR